MAEHCPGCRGYTAGWEGECPGLPVPAGTPAWRAPLDTAGHVVFDTDGTKRDNLCHCRWGEPHRIDDPSP